MTVLGGSRSTSCLPHFPGLAHPQENSPGSKPYLFCSAKARPKMRTRPNTPTELTWSLCLQPGKPWGAGLATQWTLPQITATGLRADTRWLVRHNLCKTEAVQERGHQNELCNVNLNTVHTTDFCRVTEEPILRRTTKIWLDPRQSLEKTNRHPASLRILLEKTTLRCDKQKHLLFF